ncbi:MAG TPA: hypothetical protein VL463_28605 [Kofleriaceae bacterium]|jgi:hypothetical protein|nr:hypothetical protein [Kofleriaceae bacterium]
MKRALVLLGALAACGPASDHFAIDLSLAGQGDEYACPNTTCTAVQLTCDAVVSLRIVDAADPSTVYLSKCLPLNDAPNLCAIGSLDLGSTEMNPIPNKMVRVEILVWPANEITNLQCPTDVEFDAQNKPVAVTGPDQKAPAIGGQTYFRAGTGDVATVQLGCIDLGALNAGACRLGTVDVKTTVNDFDTDVSLPTAVADTVTVGVGEPKAHINSTTQQIEWQMTTNEIVNLPRVKMDPPPPIPTWREPQVPMPFERAACIQVLEDGPQETPAITCHAADRNTTAIDTVAFKLAKSTLAQAYAALRLPGVPDQGLVVGMVVDANGNPLAGVQVNVLGGSVQYLSADRTMIDPGNSTSTSGMFVSRDAPFDGTWSATDGLGHGPSEQPIVGGLVVGKATIVYIQIE